MLKLSLSLGGGGRGGEVATATQNACVWCRGYGSTEWMVCGVEDTATQNG